MKNKRELIINFDGPMMCGKSKMMYFFKEFLRKEGFDVEYDGNTFDHPTEKNFDRVMSRNIDEALDVIKKKTLIVLQEHPIPRNTFMDEHLNK